MASLLINGKTRCRLITCLVCTLSITGTEQHFFLSIVAEISLYYDRRDAGVNSRIARTARAWLQRDALVGLVADQLG
jgi:hypothetical protein